MEQPVFVSVVTETDGDVLRFSGSGTLARDGQALHLRYTAPREKQPPLLSAVHLRGGRGLLETDSVRLLLDPRRRTHAALRTPEGAVPLEVETHRVHGGWDGASGAIVLHYTIFSGGRVLNELRVTLELTLQRRPPL